MHYLITGHTGFKGAWLSIMLLNQGHKVSGIAMDPYVAENGDRGIFELADVSKHIKQSGGSDIRLDIREHTKLEEAVKELQPDVVIHLAAQPLVRDSYLDPRFTYETNIIGTFNVMEAVENAGSVKAQLIITTDKSYANVNKVEGYLENEPLGVSDHHADPYSSSKAAADIVAQTQIRHPDSKVPTAIARGGNVIGGGDVSKDRLLVDLVRDCKNEVATFIRYPEATRPWQHVIDCNRGYLLIVEALLNGNTDVVGQAFNVGSSDSGLVSVGEIASEVIEIWNTTSDSEKAQKPVNAKPWGTDPQEHLHEANLLRLDTSKIERVLNYQSSLTVSQSVKTTVEWEKAVWNGNNPFDVTVAQLEG
jgi:CDP-glucose 4,6-dehydratase